VTTHLATVQWRLRISQKFEFGPSRTGRGLRGEEEGGGVTSGPGAARTILLFHIISARPSKQPLMVRTFLKVHGAWLLFFVSARTNKRHHHHQLSDDSAFLARLCLFRVVAYFSRFDSLHSASCVNWGFVCHAQAFMSIFPC
jgi:hypothetical protein